MKNVFLLRRWLLYLRFALLDLQAVNLKAEAANIRK